MVDTNTITTSTEDNNKVIPAPIDIKPAVIPDGLTAQQITDINANADTAITELITAKGDIFSEEADKITNIGLQDQKAISNNIQLMQEKMNSVFYNKEKSSVTDNMSKDITELQDVLAKVNPRDIQNEAKYKMVKWIPFLGNYLVNVIKQSASKGMTLQSFVEHLEDSLKQGELNIRQDNAQLKVMYEDLKQKQLIVASNGYFAEVLVEKLAEQVKDIKDDITRNNMNEILARVSSRAQNIRATENVIQQFFSSIKMTRTNNDYLLDAAREMQTNGVMVVNVSMAIHSALIRSKNVKDVVEGTGIFIGKMLVSNATLINNMVTEIGDIRKNPIIPMKMMEDAVTQLEESIDKTNKLNSEVIESSKDNRAKIKIWTEDLKTKSGELPNIDVKSLEASKTLMLKAG